jgi:hypothetical protein
VSYTTVLREHDAWLGEQAPAVEEQEVEERVEPVQQELALDRVEKRTESGEQRISARLADAGESCAAGLPPGSTGNAFDDEGGAEAAPLSAESNVQHAGAWLLVGMVSALGVYGAVMHGWKTNARWRSRMRMVLDAVVMCFGIGERCVEGVRRLATKTAGVLLRSSRAPSESWVRRVLHRYARDMGGAKLHLRMTGLYLERSRNDGAAVFYVDNHMRPYTGKHTLRKGWRMQDKRVRSGATDYYVHDEDGRPVLRVDVPEHGSLTGYLLPLAKTLRAGLGEQQRLLLAFDRGGAYATQLAELRDAGTELVTYERRPYPLLSKTAFTEVLEVDGERYAIHESRLRNLGRGRGRVRRICVLTPEGQQVNLLAVSEEPAARLLEVMLGRWVQENGFKHGNERWGINQLDGRKVEPYPPEAVIPNPARRRVDNALRLARHREGELRCKLAQLPNGGKDGGATRERAERDLAEVVEQREQLEALRPTLPKKAPLAETELAGKLVHHDSHYKTVLDTVRIACLNAEAELAAELAPHLSKPREAKKALASLFAAPGNITIADHRINVALSPAARRDELAAFERLFDVVNGKKLFMPGDPTRRPLHFLLQQ